MVGGPFINPGVVETPGINFYGEGIPVATVRQDCASHPGGIMIDANAPTVFTGTVKAAEDDARTVRLVESPVPQHHYPFGWGITAFSPAIFGPRRRPLMLYDLCLVGIPPAQWRVLAYLMRRQVAERIAGHGWRIPMPSWREIAWELGSDERAVRRAFKSLESISVVRLPDERPRMAQLSPFVHFVGSMQALEASWQKWMQEWTPAPDAWDSFWNEAPQRAQIAKAVKAPPASELGLMQELKEMALKAKNEDECPF